MQSYEGSMTGTDNVKCGGAVNGGYPCQPQTIAGTSAPAVVGTSTPVVVATGATNG